MFVCPKGVYLKFKRMSKSNSNITFASKVISNGLLVVVLKYVES